MSPTQSVLDKRRHYLSQAVFAAFRQGGSWNALKAWIVGDAFSHESEFLVRRGMREENITHLSLEELLKAKPKDSDVQILLLALDKESVSSSYDKLFELYRHLRTFVSAKPLIIFGELPLSGILAGEGLDPERSLKQVYIEVMEYLKNAFGEKDYVLFHDELLRKVREEDPEKRLSTLVAHEKVAPLLKKEEFKALLVRALQKVIVRHQASKAFESGLIAGTQKEMEELYSSLSPKGDWKKLQELGKDRDESLLYSESVQSLLPKDAKNLFFPALIWDRLEEQAGKFVDMRLGRAFNRLSSAEKYRLTNDSKYERKSSIQPLAQPEVANAFSAARFKLDQSSSLGGLMGAARSENLMEQFASRAEVQERADLSEYGEIFLAILGAYQRGAVYLGGALFEYHYTNAQNDLMLGSVLVLGKDEKLLKSATEVAETLGFPKSMNSTGTEKQLLDSFFAFERNYITFYDRVRSAVSSAPESYLGVLTQEQWELDLQATPSREPIITSENRLSKREKEKKELERQQKSQEVYLRKLEELKERKIKERQVQAVAQTQVQQEQRSVKTKEVVETPELSPAEQEALEKKRQSLASKMEEQDKLRQEMLEQRKRLEEEQLRRKQELEEKQARKKEQERIERELRLEKLAEEKRKREETRKQRAESLRQAFENFQKKKDEKKGKKSEDKRKRQQKSIGLNDLRKSLFGGSSPEEKAKGNYNPEAIKMMIRFGNDLEDIMDRTGIAPEELAEIHEEVLNEDNG